MPLPSVSHRSNCCPQAAAKLAAWNLAARSGGSWSMSWFTASLSSRIWSIIRSTDMPSTRACLRCCCCWTTKATTIMVLANSANSFRVITPFPSASKISANLMQCAMVTARSSAPDRSWITGKSSSGVKTPLPSVSTDANWSPQAAAKLAAWNRAARSGGRSSMILFTKFRSSRMFSSISSMRRPSSASRRSASSWSWICWTM
mmetsp:Transcript_14988/g.44413  ORF Transcript_14988/g.44413 Transcript_14988/m.44413 type:complete len:203 (-) Transcript_14988:53-661(-)